MVGVVHAQAGAGILREGTWAEEFALPGLYSDVTSIAVGQDDVWVGGAFWTADGEIVNNVALWDGSQWHGIGGVAGLVNALALTPDGTLYVGGRFEEAGGVAAANIACYNPDTDSWSALGEGVLGSGSGIQVNAIAIGSDGKVYVGGRFNLAGGGPGNGIARWDHQAETWESFGGVSDDTFSPGVFALAFDESDDLFAGGRFDEIAGIPAENLARYDLGTGLWSAISGGSDEAVFELATHGQVGASGYLVARSFQLFESEGEAVTLGRYDGATWEPLLLGGGGGTAISPDGRIHTGVQVPDAEGLLTRNIARYNEMTAAWESIGEGVPIQQVRVIGFGSSGEVYAGGSYFTDPIGPNLANGFLRWDGTKWQPLGDGGGVSGTIRTIIRSGPPGEGVLFAGGYFEYAGSERAFSVARYDEANRTWSDLNGGLLWEDLRLNSFGLGDVYALALRPGEALYASGVFRLAGRQDALGLARYDLMTETWTPLGGAGLANALLIGPDGELYGGGLFEDAEGGAHRGVALYDEARDLWVPVGGGFESSGDPFATINALVFDSVGTLYVGGRFTSAGGVPAERVAAWNGAAWEALGEGLPAFLGSVFALAVAPDGSLYATGDFYEPGGGDLSGKAAQWNGEEWVYLRDAEGRALEGKGFAVAIVQKGFGGYAACFGGSPRIGSSRDWGLVRWDPNTESWSPEAGRILTGVGNPAEPVRALLPVVANHSESLTAQLYIGGEFEVLEAELSEDLFRLEGGVLAGGLARFDLAGSVNSEEVEVPARGVIAYPSYPNPSNGSVTMRYQTQRPLDVRLSIYDVLGREVSVPVNGPVPAGQHEAVFDGQGLPSGVYLWRLEAGTEVQTGQFTLLK